ncbi:hypothetical protein SASPL_122278 [Salvia splendens]|uniref:mRNA export factor n=1 Tax=Salvia splendens TaxID=180675 RepID=A0A8X8XN26_SALSN|nr:hypothetical protein SASPL_122278 [Salvia splendens]
MTRNGAASTIANPNRSTEVVKPPSDSVSSLSFSPKANVFVATSWDNQVGCWEVKKSGNELSTVHMGSMSHDKPVLCSAWKDDGTTVFSGGCDKQVKMWPLASGGQPVTVAVHDSPVKEVSWIPEMNLLVTGSWDKTLRYWDLRQQSPTWVQQLPDRCYALAVQHSLMVVGTADRNIIVFDLQKPQTEYKRFVSPLQHQTRCLAAFPDKQGFLIHHTFATTGSDGTFSFWDKDNKTRLKETSRCNQAVTCSSFNHDGSIFGYSVCYDWSKGGEKYDPATAKTNIYLHQPLEADVKPRCPVGRGRSVEYFVLEKVVQPPTDSVLCSAWKDDGTAFFSGGCDNQVKMWALASEGRPVTVAVHDAPVKEVSWIPETNLLVTGSWDSTLRYWDLRQQTPTWVQRLPDRCYALAVQHPLVVVGTADRNIIVFNLQSPQTEYRRFLSPLKHQTRCLADFPDKQGFLVGSIEGKVSVHHLDESQSNKNYIFKCHRHGNEIYSVNSLKFHPNMLRCNQPITCSSFNRDGSIYAYEVCYDWSKGAQNYNPATATTKIYLHQPREGDVTPRVSADGRK